MEDVKLLPSAPAEWLDELAESEADLLAGRVVAGELVRKGLLDSMARIEAKRDGARQHVAAKAR